ncbi:CG5204 [Drosophila busckii]|uniref:CG5204 n=1 Tax=Drosophila busckii TaxID=30019 RepID=A0A0M4E1Y0_DROBS|nr:zinc finger protein 354B [Drosophila busckii]ALC39478.1 CG5204 [Drosophila busckii]
MELPSMVERAGGRLVVRSLVSGATVYQQTVESTKAIDAAAAMQHPLLAAEQLERQLLQLNKKATSLALVVPPPPPPQLLLPPVTADSQVEEVEELPQCKIRRNYSCSSCAFFTQNPRSHLSHLRDVHGEKIVINECKLCLYASRHFQKLVRHMKMVHGCSDESSGGLPGRRHVNREARKRRLEESIEVASMAPTLQQLKSELLQQEQQLLSNVAAYKRQQQQQQLQQLVQQSSNLFSMAFEFQLCMLSDPSNAQQPEQLLTPAELDQSSSDSDSQPLAEECLTPEAMDLSSGDVNSNSYKCQKCSYSTPMRARFKKHVKYHSMPLIKCASCDFHSPYKWNLDRHTKNHGANGYFKCYLCDFSTNIKQSLTIHELNHHVATRRGQKAASPPAASSLVSSAPLPTPTPMHLTLEPVAQPCESSLEPLSEEDVRTDLGYCGVETAPGYGEVTEQLPHEDADALKKVFKCPHCTFWAATASRFHVHIVGHLNRKPFECSLCSYRSNWRWDITKHIRLKAMRDKSHLIAQVLMNDETGRRNYAKYNQYLTLMKVSAEQAADAKNMRCGEMPGNLYNMPPPLDEEQQQQSAPVEPTAESAALDLRKATLEQSAEPGTDYEQQSSSRAKTVRKQRRLTVSSSAKLK